MIHTISFCLRKNFNDSSRERVTRLTFIKDQVNNRGLRSDDNSELKLVSQILNPGLKLVSQILNSEIKFGFRIAYIISDTI